jgi:hypothetical protein
LYAFEVESGKLTKTGCKGFRFVSRSVYSADGKHVAFGMADRRYDEVRRLRFVEVGDAWRYWDCPNPGSVSQFRPTAAGGFLMTTLQVTLNDIGHVDALDSVGYRWQPGDHKLEEVWRLPNRTHREEPMDFFPDKRIGVRTNHYFVTEVVDLQSEAVLGKVDNSANYHAGYSMVGETFRMLGWNEESGVTWLVSAGVALVVVVLALLAIRRRLRRWLAPGNGLSA